MNESIVLKFSSSALGLLVTVLLLLSPLAANAQDTASPSDTGIPNEARLNDLISTLESQTAREQFLERLRTLQSTQPEEEESWSIRDWFSVESTSNVFIGRFLDLVDSWGLSSSMAGKLGQVVVALLLLSLLVLINNRLARLFDRRMESVRKKFSTASGRFAKLFKIQMLFGYALAGLLFAYTIGQLFTPVAQLVDSDFLQSVVEFLFTVALLSLLLAVAWESINAVMEYGVSDVSPADSTRIKTLFPVVRTIALFSLCGFTMLVLLSELGIDILPLLAGAGVLGIAIGFGAQTLVKDYLNGFIIILENLLRVSDVVRIGDRLGEVEIITLRKIQLRSLDGTVHTIPHSEITVIDNLTKEYNYFLTDIGVAYKEDIDEVLKTLHAVGDELAEDDEYADRILEPIHIFGLDEFADSALNVKVRIKTRPHERWSVGREFNRRVKLAFDKANIEIPFPHRTVFMNPVEQGEDLQESDAA